jgi:hypothetical protein
VLPSACFVLTESFTWEDPPTRDPHTGHRTLTRWIPHLQKVVINAFAFTAFYHLVQPAILIYIYHELMFSASGIRTRSSIAGNTALLLRVLLIVINFHGSHGIENLQKLDSLRIRCHWSRQSKFHFKLKLKLIPVAPNETQDTATS